jgi:hypothetical protein
VFGACQGFVCAVLGALPVGETSSASARPQPADSNTIAMKAKLRRMRASFATQEQQH